MEPRNLFTGVSLHLEGGWRGAVNREAEGKAIHKVLTLTDEYKTIINNDNYWLIRCPLVPYPSGTPILLKRVIMGHLFVNADCRRLAPTKSVKRSHAGEKKYPRRTLRITKKPAIILK